MYVEKRSNYLESLIFFLNYTYVRLGTVILNQYYLIIIDQQHLFL